ncbi:hypothetical protein [Nioella aestuarii]|uniref:hypothetical protein n=1 Tax=Nioella aestuarii TaxID=1662864 RepID=UPI003D7FAFAB
MRIHTTSLTQTRIMRLAAVPMLVLATVFAGPGQAQVAPEGTESILWQHREGRIHYWPMSNGERLGGVNISGLVGAEWTLLGSGDITGDGMTTWSGNAATGRSMAGK